MAITDDAQTIAEIPNLIHAIATLIKCIAFYIFTCGLKVFFIDVLKMDLASAIKAWFENADTHFKAPTFQAQGGNWPSGDSGQEKREI
ncbi:hypothetical protein QM012_000413 [Aureobasidium pullulans]|uniref:Uncharacterized protein n=1 Tax=Aureobasidium pullulans TaxID=5580 RepID=A0ABR0TX98_AURPU